MLLVPFFAGAILARAWRWAEVAALAASFVVFAAKDPMVVVARQRWVWRDRRPETDVAWRWLAWEAVILAVCAVPLALVWPIWALAGAAVGAGAFSVIAVAMTVRNRQRSTLLQIASAIALTATALAACLSATGAIPGWGWRLWALCGLQATAGILVVHARLEARIAARKGESVSQYRRPAMVAVAVLVVAAVVARNFAISGALLLAEGAYAFDLWRQLSAQSLQMPLTRVGLQSLGLSIVYTVLIVAGLWS